jgi:hypothetical protein
VLQPGKDVAQAALQRVGRGRRRSGLVEGEHGNIARRPSQGVEGLQHVEHAALRERQILLGD